LQRRHPDKPNYLADFPLIPPAQFIANTGETDNVLLINKITETIERFSNRLIETERNIRSEMEAKLQAQSTARSRDTGAEERQQERLNYQRELQDLKTMMARQLEEEKALLREERKALEALRVSLIRSLPYIFTNETRWLK
jgi:hypothetical protein